MQEEQADECRHAYMQSETSKHYISHRRESDLGNNSQSPHYSFDAECLYVPPPFSRVLPLTLAFNKTKTHIIPTTLGPARHLNFQMSPMSS